MSIPHILLLALLPVAAVEPDGPSAGGPNYHADPDHLWNRLHEALFVRIGQDGLTYGHDRLEPLLWPETTYLLNGPAHNRAVELLREFLDQHGEKLIDEPLKRAVLQRDLWLVFNWLEGHSGMGPQEAPAERQQLFRQGRSRLRPLLAGVIGRLAFEPEQVRILPDNYAAAVKSGEFARSPDPGRTDASWLPPDLFKADGPWVCIGRPDGPIAPEHLREDRGNVFTNSAFIVLLRLPGGRAETLEYLRQPRALPPGAQVALVRRALLIASDHSIRASSLTESVQLRVYREQSQQSFQEFRLSRRRLSADRAGGLRAVGPDEVDFKTGFGGKPYDQFEFVFPGQSWSDVNRKLITGTTCFACHNDRFFDLRSADAQAEAGTRPDALRANSPAEALDSAVEWKMGRPDWAALCELLSSQDGGRP